MTVDYVPGSIPVYGQSPALAGDVLLRMMVDFMV